jgi:pimeloyl-ACP methyl ester carboxylesterase
MANASVARATTEPVGLGAAGGLLQTDLKKEFPEAAVYAVKYPASMGSLNTCEGPKDLIARVMERVNSCPGIKIALGGHSQGGAVVTATIEKIPQKYLKSIVAVTLFGSPPCSDLTKSTVAGVAEVGAKCKSFCNDQDQVGLLATISNR